MEFLNRVSPEIRMALKDMPDLRIPEDLPFIRRFPPPPRTVSEHVAVANRSIPGQDGDIQVRIYEPASRGTPSLPVVLWMFGGGYVAGRPENHDDLLQEMVLTCRCVVVAVNYRLAPEHPYPAAIQDCYACLKWLADYPDILAIDPQRIAVAGASAGGGIAISLALMARDRGGPSIAFQMPLYPMIDDRNQTPSSHEVTSKSAPWNRDRNVNAWTLYLGHLVSGNVPIYAAPARAIDLSGLPPAYTCVGELDLFRDETIAYVTRLAQAGVPVEFHLYPGCYHGFDDIAPEAEVSRMARSQYLNALARALDIRKDE